MNELICKNCHGEANAHACPKDVEAEKAKLRAEVEKGAKQIDGLLFAAGEAATKEREMLLQNERLQKIVNAAVKLEEVTRCEHGGRVWSSVSEKFASVLFSALKEIKPTEKPKDEPRPDTCENFRNNKGDVQSRFCSTFYESGSHVPTCQFADKRKQEPHYHGHEPCFCTKPL